MRNPGLVGEIDDGQHAVRAGTVGELCERWYAHAAPDPSPAVAAEYRRLLDRRILPRWADVPLRRLRAADLDQWYSELRRSGAARGKPHEETTTILLAHRAACEELAAKCGAKLSASSFLFSHEVDFSKPWRPNYATLAFGRPRDELGLDGVKLHHLRHFSATQLLSAGIDIRTVSGRLGHANASTTLDFYAQFLQAADERAADALGALLSSLPRPRD